MSTSFLSLPKPFTKTTAHFRRSANHHHHVHTIIRSTGDGRNSTSSDGENDGASPSIPPPITPPGTVGIQFKRWSRRSRRREQENGPSPKAAKASAPKDWESMTLTEKAVELYVGEKGLLFWLNKFAYASIFIIIGGWILFRFVGPALNLYQLDSPPLSPTSILKGS